MFDIQEELKKLPAKPGVYLMHNAQDEIIYVGKARILKNRVRQYFQSSYNKSVKIQHMVSHIAYFEYIITDSELEALVLECNMCRRKKFRWKTIRGSRSIGWRCSMSAIFNCWKTVGKR